jgi:NDP-4-keto-2,6-dideoxyhexose 3-C-methyltransferase
MFRCRGCGSDRAWLFLNLGNQALPRFPKTLVEIVPRAPLDLVKCESCHLVQLLESVDRDLLFREFWYQSGISTTIKNDLKNIAGDGKREAGPLKHGDTVVDIGCNDGTLLSFFDESLNRVGFEPAANLAKMARQHGRIVEDYFTDKGFHRESFYSAKLIFAIAMFYDLEDPVEFCREVSNCLREDGVFIVQQNYLGLMLQNVAYDNVCHEHLTYFSLASLKNVLDQADLEVYHVELSEINGGSFKTFIGFKGKKEVDDSVKLMEATESDSDYRGRKIYRDFAYRVRTEARMLNGILSKPETVMIYGAGTRGATLLQFAAKFQKPKIVSAVDNNAQKHDRYYLDTGIPIISREEALKNPPDYFLVLPYHLADEIIEKEKENFPKSQWIVPLPELRIV